MKADSTSRRSMIPKCRLAAAAIGLSVLAAAPLHAAEWQARGGALSLGRCHERHHRRRPGRGRRRRKLQRHPRQPRDGIHGLVSSHPRSRLGHGRRHLHGLGQRWPWPCGIRQGGRRPRSVRARGRRRLRGPRSAHRLRRFALQRPVSRHQDDRSARRPVRQRGRGLDRSGDWRALHDRLRRQVVYSRCAATSADSGSDPSLPGRASARCAGRRPIA